ncbi:MAG TPA: response regulator transcription factor [Chitinophagaceae bacterium]|jgi:DNA-binding NarL/FixJ family response regulator|nr:response regulator transcription factor [Chitinophagaceae bacterium]HEX5654761.1 response regulator transcription factor [Chitinophagaceae bacterium]
MSISIAIVEDLDEVRDGLKSFISLNTDFTVVGDFKTGEEALTNLPRLSPDIVIMDINLPGMNGIECIRQVKDKSPGTQFMMFTVYENDEKVFEALKAGASGYLLKNTGLLQIVESLTELHQGGSPMSANIARKLVNLFRDNGNKTVSMDVLSNRENEILHLLSKGLLYKEIADQLHITTSTVRQHIHKIYEKLHVQNRTEAINKALGK